ncbi:MAG: MOSC domain-containing protein [Bacteroidota bacterium]
MAKLEAIWIKRAKQGPMDSKSEAELVAGKGLRDNANQKGRRQVTIIEQEVWEMLMAELGGDLPPTSRRANLMVSGFPLKDSRGKVLRIGNCRIIIKGETKPCNLMEETLPGLRERMFPEWRGGAFGQVLDDGIIRVGDTLSWETEEAIK